MFRTAGFLFVYLLLSWYYAQIYWFLFFVNNNVNTKYVSYILWIKKCLVYSFYIYVSLTDMTHKSEVLDLDYIFKV